MVVNFMSSNLGITSRSCLELDTFLYGLGFPIRSSCILRNIVHHDALDIAGPGLESSKSRILYKTTNKLHWHSFETFIFVCTSFLSLFKPLQNFQNFLKLYIIFFTKPLLYFYSNVKKKFGSNSFSNIINFINGY